MKKSILLTVFSFLTATLITTASNPLANLQFYSTFNYLEEVAWVENNGVLDGRIAPFLMEESTPIDQKAAVINAFTINNKIKNNAMTFKQFMARKYGQDFRTLNLSDLSAQELFCLGYLTLMDEGGNTDKALPILEMAVKKDPASKTIATIHALALGQKALNDGDNCSAWKVFESVQNNAELNDDLNGEIMNFITAGFEVYQSACN